MVPLIGCMPWFETLCQDKTPDNLFIAYAQISEQILLTVGHIQFTTGMKWIHVKQKGVDNAPSSVQHSVRVAYSCSAPVVVKVLQYRH